MIHLELSWPGLYLCFSCSMISITLANLFLGLIKSSDLVFMVACRRVDFHPYLLFRHFIRTIWILCYVSFWIKSRITSWVLHIHKPFFSTWLGGIDFPYSKFVYIGSNSISSRTAKIPIMKENNKYYCRYDNPYFCSSLRIKIDNFNIKS